GRASEARAAERASDHGARRESDHGREAAGREAGSRLRPEPAAARDGSRPDDSGLSEPVSERAAGRRLVGPDRVSHARAVEFHDRRRISPARAVARGRGRRPGNSRRAEGDDILSARERSGYRHGPRIDDCAGSGRSQWRADRVYEPAGTHGVSDAVAADRGRRRRRCAGTRRKTHVTTPGLNVWIVDDDESVRWVLEQALKQAQMVPRTFDSARALLRAFERDRPDVLVTDIRMPDMSGLELMERLAASDPEVPVIVITAHSDLDSAVSAYQGGAFEYLPKPFDIDEAIELVSRAARHNGRHQSTESPTAKTPRIIGHAPAMQDVFKAIGRLSRSSMTVLITGESGTGKELVARALHENSPRAREPFVALNTSAIAAELLESELFGHEKGAFTGAMERRIGRFEQADGGTLFLDEIGDMSPALQTRLLRVLAESEFFRVGGQTPIRVDVRVIA